MKYKIATTLNKEAVIKKIADLLVENNRLAGNVSDDKFKIRKNPFMTVRNSFSPIFEGKIEEHSDGCLVHIKARLYHFTSIALVIWCLVFGTAILAFNGDSWIYLVAAMVTITVMLVLGFIIPATQIINKIKSILKQ